MILDVYEQVTGSLRPSLLSQREFGSLDELFGQYDRRTQPTLLMVEPQDLTEVLTWIGDDDDICLTTDPSSLVEHRLQCLGLPDSSRFDALTGLLGRGAFDQALTLAQQDESLSTCSLILCDVDQFKRLNDVHGHASGDQALVAIAEMLRAAGTERDLIARFGGEIFAILSDRELEDSEAFAERIREDVAAGFAGGLNITVSIGVSTEGKSKFSDLVRRADEALYAAKAAGRNNILHFTALEAICEETGQNPAIAGLENRSRVLSERLTSFITLRTGKVLNQIRNEADTDDLTKFYTRGYLDRRLAREVQNRRVPMCIAFADIDHFGAVNKNLGWPTGDKVLRAVCDLIRTQLRDTDWVGRYGGEEFCIVMQNTKLSEALPVLERLRTSVAEHPFSSPSGESLEVTISIGAVESTSDEGYEDLLERASEKALSAKNQGRNCVMA